MRFYIKSLERWETEAEYEVEADDAHQALLMVSGGKVAYDKHEHTEDDEFLMVLEIERIE